MESPCTRNNKMRNVEETKNEDMTVQDRVESCSWNGELRERLLGP